MNEREKAVAMLEELNKNYPFCCYDCPFDGGGVSDCRGVSELGMCVIDKAIELLQEEKC